MRSTATCRFASASGEDRCVPLGLEDLDDDLAVIALDLDHTVFHRATHAAPLLELARQFLEARVVDRDAGDGGHGLAAAAGDFAPDLDAIAVGPAFLEPRITRFAQIAKSVGAYFVVDMAHVAGLVATGFYPNPVPHADVVTSTTHKTLRGPRGGLILARPNDEIAKKLNSLVFPGTQGGPLEHVIAAKAVAFLEALQPEFKEYQRQVVANARALCKRLMARGFPIVSGGTDNHLFLLALTKHSITGKDAGAALGHANITVNKNAIPNDPRPPAIASGLRIGTPASTTRGFKEREVEQVGDLMAEILEAGGSADVIERVRPQVIELCRRFPVYGS